MMRRILLIFIAIFVSVIGAFMLWPGRGVAPWSENLVASDPSPDLAARIAAEEETVSDLREGTARELIWAREAGRRTDWAVVYIHGFSASRDEIRPVPDLVADALGANLYYHRLTGHGRSDDAMADATAEAWLQDMAQALQIGQSIGERVLVIGTSTGGTLTALAATDAILAPHIDAVVLVSPNFSIGRAGDTALSRPGVERWGHLVFGKTRGFTPNGPEDARVWTYSYPWQGLLPLGPVLTEARRRDPATAPMPALFIYADDDEVVDASATTRWLEGWGGGAERMVITPSEGVDPQMHVVAGDIRSPLMNNLVAERIVQFLVGN